MYGSNGPRTHDYFGPAGVEHPFPVGIRYDKE
jgi:hypothetical protein